MDELVGVAALEAIADEWRALWSRAPAATTFQRPEWLLPWLRHLGPGAEDVRSLALRVGGRLVALAPCFVWRDRGERVLSLAGAGISDYCDLLCEEECAVAAAEAVLAWAAGGAAGGARWNRSHFDELPPLSPLLHAAAPAGSEDQITPGSPCPVLTLPRTVEALAGTVPSGFWSRLAYARRRAAREGFHVETATRDDSGEWLDTLFRLHRARWTERGDSGVLDDPAVRAFHRDAARRLAGAGALRFYGVRAPGGALVAVLYGFSDKGRASYYLGGFDPAYDRLGPGDLVVLHAVEEAVRSGAREFDFLRGAERYKYVWGARDRYNRRRQLRHVEAVLHEPEPVFAEAR